MVVVYFFFPRKILHPKTMKLIEQTGVEKYFFLFFFPLYFLTILEELQSIVFTIYEGSTFPFSLEKLR